MELNNEELKLIGFKKIGSGWFRNSDDTIRIKVWKDFEMDFWLHHSQSDRELRFRGRIFNMEGVVWVLDRCFDYEIKEQECKLTEDVLETFLGELSVDESESANGRRVVYGRKMARKMRSYHRLVVFKSRVKAVKVFFMRLFNLQKRYE